MQVTMHVCGIAISFPHQKFKARQVGGKVIPRALFKNWAAVKQSKGNMQAAAASLGSRQVRAAESQAARTSGGLFLRERMRQAPQKTSD